MLINKPIPNITGVLEKLGRCQYFSAIDLAGRFHQIKMSQQDIEKGFSEWDTYIMSTFESHLD